MGQLGLTYWTQHFPVGSTWLMPSVGGVEDRIIFSVFKGILFPVLSFCYTFYFNKWGVECNLTLFLFIFSAVYLLCENRVTFLKIKIILAWIGGGFFVTFVGRYFFHIQPSAVWSLAIIAEPTFYKLFFSVLGLYLYWIYFNGLNTFFSKIIFEQLILVLCILIFGSLLITCNHFIDFFIVLTGLSLCLYVLIAQPKHLFAIEAATKYYGLGLASVALTLFGILLLYAEYGSLLFSDICWTGNIVSKTNQRFGSGLEVSGLVLLLVGIFFKLSAFPAFLWAADVYEGSSLFVVGILLISKLAVFGVLANVLFIFSSLQGFVWAPLLFLSGVGSLFVGTFGAILQQKLRRFLAFSSINHLGFVLLGAAFEIGPCILAASYLVVYILATIVLFVVVLRIRRRNGSNVVYITELHHSLPKLPLLSAVFVASVFSLAGIPPFIGFFTKYAIFLQCFITNTLGGSAAFFVCLFLLAFSAFNYLRLLKATFFRLGPVKMQLFRTWDAGVWHEWRVTVWTVFVLLSGTFLWRYLFVAIHFSTSFLPFC